MREESKTIFVAAEGEGTEYDYFQHVNRVFKVHQGPWLAFPKDSEQRGLTPEAVVRLARSRFEALMADDGLRHAIQRARALDAGCTYESCPGDDGGHSSACLPSKRDPSTAVWHLVRALDIITTT